MRSIRRDLVLELSVGTAVLAALAGLVSGRAIENRIRRDFDDALHSKAQALVTLTEQKSGVIQLEFADEAMPEFSVRQPLEYFEIWASTGEVVERSRSLQDGHLPRRMGSNGEPRFSDALLPDGRRGHLISLAFVPQLEDDRDPWAEHAANQHPESSNELREASLTLARGTEELEGLVRSIYAADLAVAGGLACALALLVGWVVRRGFAPLSEVARRVGTLDEHSLASRLEVNPPVLELEPIVRRLNLLLERLEGAFERERRFSGDVAHELRTPVAELRTLSEVGERWSGDADLARDLFRDAAKVAGRMERSVEQMLAMARAEAGRDVGLEEAIYLEALIDECLSAQGVVSESAGTRVTRNLDRSLVVCTHREMFVLVLRNLLDNAFDYSPAESSIEIVSRALPDGQFVLEISNLAPNLEARDVAHLFERFWRKDAARSDSRHSGLGLALVRSLCGLLGFGVEASLDETDRRLTVVVKGATGAGKQSPSAV